MFQVSKSEQSIADRCANSAALRFFFFSAVGYDHGGGGGGGVLVVIISYWEGDMPHGTTRGFCYSINKALSLLSLLLILFHCGSNTCHMTRGLSFSFRYLLLLWRLLLFLW